jgi:ankyrin repeat protein
MADPGVFLRIVDDIENPEDHAGLVCLATEEDKSDFLRELITRGFPVNDQGDHLGRTPLMLACEMSNLEMLQLLVSAGADVSLRDEFGRTALTLAAESGWQSAIDVLVQSGIEVDTADDLGWTSAHVAAAAGHVGTLSALLHAGAKPDRANLLGWTPLIMAAEGGHDNCVAVLLAAGADAKKRDIFGRSALLLSASAGEVACLELLLSGRDKPDQDDLEEAAATAAKGGHCQAVHLILRHLLIVRPELILNTGNSIALRGNNDIQN